MSQAAKHSRQASDFCRGEEAGPLGAAGSRRMFFNISSIRPPIHSKSVFRHRELHCVVSASHLPGTSQLSLRTYHISCLHSVRSFRCEVIEKYISSRPCQMYDHQLATTTVGLLHTYAIASTKSSSKTSNTRLMHLVATRISCCLLM